MATFIIRFQLETGVNGMISNYPEQNIWMHNETKQAAINKAKELLPIQSENMPNLYCIDVVQRIATKTKHIERFLK